MPPLTDDLVLLDTEFDSLCFALLVARMEDQLGVDPFSTLEVADLPVTLGDLVALYDRRRAGGRLSRCICARDWAGGRLRRPRCTSRRGASPVSKLVDDAARRAGDGQRRWPVGADHGRRADGGSQRDAGARRAGAPHGAAPRRISSPARWRRSSRDAEIDLVVTDDGLPLAELAGLALHRRQCGSASRPSPSDTRRNGCWRRPGPPARPSSSRTLWQVSASAILAGAPAEQASVWGTFYDIRRYGGLQVFLRAMAGPASLVLSDPDEPVGDFLARLAHHGATHVLGTPSHWRRALMSPALATLAPRYVRLSGEIADQTILDRLKAAFPNAAPRPCLCLDRGRRRLHRRRRPRKAFPLPISGSPATWNSR